MQIHQQRLKKNVFSNWCWNFFTTLEKILKKKALNQIPQFHLVYHQQNSFPTKNHTVRKHLSAVLFRNRGQEEKESRTIVQFDFSGNFFSFQSMRCDLHRTLCPWGTSIRQKNTTQKGVMWRERERDPKYLKIIERKFKLCIPLSCTSTWSFSVQNPDARLWTFVTFTHRLDDYYVRRALQALDQSLQTTN